MSILKKYKFLLFTTIFSLAFIVFFAWKIFTKKDNGFSHLVNRKPNHELDVSSILNLLKNNDSVFLKANEVLEIEGHIKEINYKNDRTTIFLGIENDNNAYVICDMQNNQKEEITKLNIEDKVKLKGVYKGYLANAIFLNCIISKTNYE